MKNNEDRPLKDIHKKHASQAWDICRTFQKLLHVNAPRHFRASAPKFCTNQKKNTFAEP